jgi:hypothetical protein
VTAVAVALVAALVVALASFTSLVRSLIRQHARERDLLVNQILHLSGRTWTPPPADEWAPATDGEPLVREWTAQPEQEPYV